MYNFSFGLWNSSREVSVHARAKGSLQADLFTPQLVLDKLWHFIVLRFPVQLSHTETL